MSDLNAAPSITKADEIAAETTGISSGGNAGETAVISSASTEAGTAAAGESNAAQGADASMPENATYSTDASLIPMGNGATLAGDDPNAGASPAGGQSASDTASSAQGTSLDGGTEADALRAEIASLQQQLTDEQANVAKWQGMYNAATAAKPHAQSLLQKLEAGEAIVLGDLQSRLRAFLEAL
ncbi:hypothetical protein C7S15_1632 [Burkholderia cepacia]|uniref:hypothetical protein n=1 Tax=Burkholderia cepacia TaxID=292 RepID=UPI00298F9989|nr:hypothetical protein [Burkholderia cepacia]MDW9227065.1 hypothetical protein [Burkholderia cepacia]